MCTNVAMKVRRVLKCYLCHSLTRYVTLGDPFTLLGLRVKV